MIVKCFMVYYFVLKKTLEIVGVLPVYFYRLVIRPFLPKSCAFVPTCSAYALIAIRRHGVVVGWWMTGKRLLRCRPWGRGNSGYNPVEWGLAGGAKWVV